MRARLARAADPRYLVRPSMPPVKQSIIEARGPQMFPTLEPAEIERLRQFGVPQCYRDGEALVKIGETGHGMTVILSGQVAVTQRDVMGHRELIVTHGPGS